jgi:hypothetical protein
LETDVSRKVLLGGALALVLVGGPCLVSPGLGGIALILLALCALAGFAYRLL